MIGLRLVFVDPAEREVTLDCWIHPQLPDADQRSLLGNWPRSPRGGRAPGDRRRAGTPAEAADPWQASPRVWQLVAGAYRQDRVWSEQLQSLGLRQVRTFQRMRLEHGLAVPEPTRPRESRSTMPSMCPTCVTPGRSISGRSPITGAGGPAGLRCLGGVPEGLRGFRSDAVVGGGARR